MNEYTWSDLRVGMTEAFDVLLTPGMFDAFRELSGDTNPLHGSHEYAKSVGFEAPVAFGLLTSSFYSRLVGVHLPGKLALFHALRIDFTAPAFAGDRLTVSGTIIHLSEAVRRVEIKAAIVNQRGETISRAKLSTGLHG